MDVSISVDFGQGYRVSLTPVDARKLYEQLKPLFDTQPSMSLTTSTNGALWNALGLNTVPEMPAQFVPGPSLKGLSSVSNYFTAKVDDATVDKMASELEAKVKAEMDKQGLTDEGIAANKKCSCKLIACGCLSEETAEEAPCLDLEHPCERWS